MSAPTLFLYGTYELSLDDKGRAVLPAPFRRVLAEECGGQLVLTQSLTDPCLWLYPQPMWDSLLEELNQLSALTHPAVQSMQRLLLSSAQSLKVDGQGRITLSPVLRAFAGINTKNFYLLGFQHKFELWAPQALTKKQEQDRETVRQALSSPDSAALFGTLRI